jgi:hypothetical protein
MPQNHPHEVMEGVKCWVVETETGRLVVVLTYQNLFPALVPL